MTEKDANNQMNPDGTPETPAEVAAQSEVIAAVKASTPIVANDLGMAESKAEEYILSKLFGNVRGSAYYAILTGSTTVQAEITAGNVQALSWLEKIFLELEAPALESAFVKLGLA